MKLLALHAARMFIALLTKVRSGLFPKSSLEYIILMLYFHLRLGLQIGLFHSRLRQERLFSHCVDCCASAGEFTLIFIYFCT